MANTVGSLVVRLALDAADYVGALNKAEVDAKKFAARLEDGVASAAKGAGIAIGIMATAATAAFVAVDQLVKKAAEFKDIEERTGASAEALASFSVAATVAGTSVEAIGAFIIKMAKNLAGVDDESKAAGAALTALNIPIEEFKRLDPAEKIERLAKAVAQFNDSGDGKAAALESIAKGGAQLLPFLKELETQGGRQIILTQRQIELADEYADKQARAKATLQEYAQVLAIQALPAINAVTKAANEYIAELIGIDSAAKKLRENTGVADFAENVATAFAFVIDTGDSVARIFSIVGNVIGATAAQIRAAATGDFKAYADIQKDASRTIDDIIAKETFRARVARQFATQRATDARRSIEDRGFDPRPQVNFNGKAPGDGRAGRAERQSDAERYLQTLERQLQATFELSAVEKVTLDIMSGRLKLSNGITEQQLLGVAQAIDNAKAEAAARKELAKTLEDEARARVAAGKINRDLEDAAVKERDKIIENNQALRDEIAIITGGEAARKAIEKARLSSAIALKEDTAAQLENAGASQIEIQAIRAQIDALKERQTLLGQKDFAEQLAADAMRIADINQQFADSFSNALQGVANGTKTVRQAFKDLEKDIVAIISRIAANNLAKAIFGGQEGGGAFDFGSLIQKFFGGSGGGGGGFDFGSMFGGGGGFAAGGMPPVGKLSLVGEQGPELFIPKVAGTIVPNESVGAMMGSSTVVVNVPQGTSRASASQIAAEVQRRQSAATRRNF